MLGGMLAVKINFGPFLDTNTTLIKSKRLTLELLFLLSPASNLVDPQYYHLFTTILVTKVPKSGPRNY